LIPGNGAALGASGGRLWAAPEDGLVARIDTATARAAESVDPKTSASAIAVGSDAVWVAGVASDTVTRIDPTGLVTPIAVGRAPVAVAVGAGGVWVADADDGAVVRIDPQTNSVKTTIPVGEPPDSVVVGLGSVWVSHGDAGTVSQIDPA